MLAAARRSRYGRLIMAEPGFTIVFEYRVAADSAAAFETAYGSDGEWARFFAADPAYLGTELWAVEDEPGRYLLADRWESAEAYDAFRARFRGEYERRSSQAEALYEAEVLLGRLRRR
jgi:heme-degrading monooxygenase HmoA